MKFLTIVADQQWQQPLSGKYRNPKNRRPDRWPYDTMSLEAICQMPVADLADKGCHCWLWTTNAFLEPGFEVLRRWGFKYLAPIHWIKPSGMGNYVVHRTQTILLGYRDKCVFDRGRYFPNIISTSSPHRHSQKPEESYKLIEQVSHEERLELFARRARPGWHSHGDEIEGGFQI